MNDTGISTRYRNYARWGYHNLVNVLPPPANINTITDIQKCIVFQYFDSNPILKWDNFDALNELQGMPENGVLPDVYQVLGQDYKTYLNSTRFDGTTSCQLMDKLDFFGQGTCSIPAGTRATLRGNTNDPIMVLPKDTSAVKVYVSVAIASGMIHSGLIFELDKNNKNYQTCSLITNSSFVENEITPKFFWSI